MNYIPPDIDKMQIYKVYMFVLIKILFAIRGPNFLDNIIAPLINNNGCTKYNSVDDCSSLE